MSGLDRQIKEMLEKIPDDPHEALERLLKMQSDGIITSREAKRLREKHDHLYSMGYIRAANDALREAHEIEAIIENTERSHNERM